MVGERSTITIDFPGRWLGGVTLILGPLLLFVGVALRYNFNFFFPDQLAAYHEHPTLLIASYSTFAAGNVLMWPAVIMLAKMISAKRPGWAFWGGTFAIFGLFARTFHAGIDHLAFQLVREQNVDLATKVIANSYGSFHIFKTFNLAIMLGWIRPRNWCISGCYIENLSMCCVSPYGITSIRRPER
ncbi:hypothetical protein AB6A23_09110 [Paenibacillus tarimensis]